MIERQTLLVVGAGASIPFKFPSGRELVTAVCAGLRKDNRQLFQLLRACGFGAEQIVAFRDALARSGRPSVDRFLEFRTEFMAVGKTAIAATLIPFEGEDALFGSDRNWIEYVWHQLGDLHDIAQGQLSIVTFNYDRAIEHYLLTVLQSAHGVTPEKATRYVQQAIPIIHVYGELGGLPLLDGRGARPYQPADPRSAPAVAFAAKDSIKIVHEGVDDNLALGRARQLVTEANVICFLGFGYLPENLKRIGIHDRKADAIVWGSAHGVGHAQRHEIDRIFKEAAGKQPIILGGPADDALEFLRQHPVFAP
ncbi:MAG: hypothetical protein Q8Q14_09045 [Gemmatimonadales bacterium]|nr:hypothetical protein [Gemmatimonadales bacterium]